MYVIWTILYKDSPYKSCPLMRGISWIKSNNKKSNQVFWGLWKRICLWGHKTFPRILNFTFAVVHFHSKNIEKSSKISEVYSDLFFQCYLQCKKEFISFTSTFIISRLAELLDK